MSEKAALSYPKKMPAQELKQDSEGKQEHLEYAPHSSLPSYKGSEKLKDHVAIITGGDSGIGLSVAILFAREGAKVVIVYHSNDEDAENARKLVEKEGQECLTIKSDVGQKSKCNEIVEQTVSKFGRLDILVNNAGIQFVKEDVRDIDEEQLEKVFRTNIYSMFFMTQAALPHLLQSPNPSIINNTSINAWKGHGVLIDYTSTKGAIVGFTRSMAQNLAKEGVRVNMVAPGPIWTPLIPSTFSADMTADFGQNTPLGRPGQPEEVAPSFVFLASRESSYITGQVIHVNGGHSY